MHIEPGIVAGAKLALGYATAAGVAGFALKTLWAEVRESRLAGLALRSVCATLLVFCFFEVLPHFPVGVSEVHFILGTTLFLIFGAGPAALGLALGLLLQGMLLAPLDLPQYGMNLTTLLVPLIAMQALAKRIIAPQTAYVDLSYAQVAKLSALYQGGIVAWVAFWAFYGQGFGAENVGSVLAFGSAYLLVICIEPLVDLAVLAGAKVLRGSGLEASPLITPRLFG